MSILKKYWQYLLFFVYYICWFLAVFMGQKLMGAWALLSAVLFFVVSRYFYKVRIQSFILLIIGLAFDWLSIYLNWVQVYEVSPLIIPFWLIAIWMIFVFSLPMFESFLGQRYKLASILGMILGPLSYKSGESFGVLKISANETLIYYGLFWACYFPTALYYLFKKTDNSG